MMTPVFRKLALKTAVVAVVYAALLFGIIIPKLMSVRKLNAGVQAAFQENQALQAAILTEKNSGDRLEEIKASLAAYQKQVLDQEDLARTLDQIGSVAQSVRLKVLSLQALDKPRALPGTPFIDRGLEVQQMRIELNAEGKYPDILSYFNELKKLPYPAIVETVSLKRASSTGLVEGEEPVLHLGVTLAVLMRLPPDLNSRPGGLS